MNRQKICVIADSGCDVPEEIRQQYDIRMIPLKIMYPEGEYLDQIDISAQQVYDRLHSDIPKTSLPDGETILGLLEKAKEDGYEKALIVCISSGLSGTYNMARILCDSQDFIETFVLDTRNISFGSGVFAVIAAQWIENGMCWEDLVQKLPLRLHDSKVFFCLDTLEYLRKGGRLGLVAAIAGSALHIKPIISCNEEGVYYVMGKALGRKKSLTRMMEIAVNHAIGGVDSLVSMLDGNARQEADVLKERLLDALDVNELLVQGQISPSLVVHTGPGLVGIHVLRNGMTIPC